MAALPIPAGKRNSVLALIKAKGCFNMAYIRQKLVTYDDGRNILFEFSKTFDCDPQYLVDILSIFDDSELLSINIYFNKSGVTITNPDFVVNSTNVVVNITAPLTLNELDIVGSQVNAVNIQNVNVDVVSISGISEVGQVKVFDNAVVGNILVKACGSNTAELGGLLLQTGGQVREIIADDPAIFGGYECEDETQI